MIRSTLAIAVLLLSVSVMAQKSYRMVIKSLPEFHASGSSIYVAGSFNGWNPQDEKFKFQQDDAGEYFFNLTLPTGIYEYKITRGGWDKVECKKGGVGVDNRVLKVDSVGVIPGLIIGIQLHIEEWQDRFAPKPKASTASKNVKIIDTAFLIPQLNRLRRVWIYLPENYASSGTRYPVLYMHDGQNVFDDATSFGGEWGIDEFLDSTTMKQCIVVAVDNGSNKRLNEYSPYDFSLKTLGLSTADTLNKGEGNQYVDFLVKTIKPFIDRSYRTRKDKESTFIAGSSMGGLISLYAVLKYPKVFGGAGVFSPAFWVAPKIFEDIRSKAKNTKAKIYFYAGKQEGETMVPLTLKAFDTMSKISKSKMTTVIRDDGKHNEPAWRKEFPLFYEWLIKQ